MFAGSQPISFMLDRYVVAVEPLAPALPEILVRALAPTVQRYLIGDLAGAARSADLTEAGAALPCGRRSPARSATASRWLGTWWRSSRWPPRCPRSSCALSPQRS